MKISFKSLYFKNPFSHHSWSNLTYSSITGFNQWFNLFSQCRIRSCPNTNTYAHSSIKNLSICKIIWLRISIKQWLILTNYLISYRKYKNSVKTKSKNLMIRRKRNGIICINSWKKWFNSRYNKLISELTHL